MTRDTRNIFVKLLETAESLYDALSELINEPLNSLLEHQKISIEKELKKARKVLDAVDDKVFPSPEEPAND